MIRFKELVKHLTVEALLVWLVSGGIAISWGLAYCFASNLSNQIRYTGTALQFSGLVTVAIGISQLRRMFGKTPVLECVGNWFRRLVGIFRKPVTGYANVSQGGAVGGGTGFVTTFTASSKLKLKERVERLEKELKNLKEDHSNKLRDLSCNLSRVETLVHDEGNKRQTGDADISKKLEEVAVGGIHLEMVGLVWLLLGMLGTSIPKELADLLYYVSIHSPF
jgi:hypothetical protein